MKFLDRYFKIKENGSNIRTEIIAGITTFVSSMYIIVVNPLIVSNSGLSFSAVLTATVILSGFCTLMMGMYAKLPVLIASGMGLNAFFTYTVVIGNHVKPEVALGAVFWAGVIFFLLSAFNVRNLIVNAIPKQVRYAVSGGIGLFITLIGFANAGFIIGKAPLIGMAEINVIIATFIAGLFITSILVALRVKGALIIGILISTIICIPIGRWYGDASVVNAGVTTLVNWDGFYAAPDFSLLFKLDLVNSLSLAMLPVIFSLVFTDMFDSLSSLIGVAEAGNIKDENGEPKNLKKALIVDSIATGLAGILGTTSGTAYIESATGVKEGGRTGMTAVVAGLLFLPFMFLSPLVSMVPSIATAPALVLVGVFMIIPITKINWSDYTESIPAFLAIVLIPFTYSITNGIIWGFLSWTILKLISRKYREISPTLIVIDILAILLLIYGH